MENDPKGNESCFELAGSSSYRGFELAVRVSETVIIIVN